MSYEEIYKDLLEEFHELKKKYDELKTKYLATVQKQIVEKLEWIKNIGKLNDRIRKLEGQRVSIH